MVFITFHWFITILYVKRPTQTSRKIIKIETSLCLNFPRGNVGNVGAVHSVSASGVATLIAFNGFEFCCVHTASAKQNFRVWCSRGLRVVSYLIPTKAGCWIPKSVINKLCLFVMGLHNTWMLSFILFSCCIYNTMELFRDVWVCSLNYFQWEYMPINVPIKKYIKYQV